jgi:hypothetical protein
MRRRHMWPFDDHTVPRYANHVNTTDGDDDDTTECHDDALLKA